MQRLERERRSCKQTKADRENQIKRTVRRTFKHIDQGTAVKDNAKNDTNNTGRHHRIIAQTENGMAKLRLPNVAQIKATIISGLLRRS